VPPHSATQEAAALRGTGAAPLRPGDPRRVGPYVPVALLGSGGMGRVYLARLADDEPGLFAVKVIRPEYAEDPRFRRRFEREALVHSRVRTPHTPRLCGTGFQDELLWMATEYLPTLDLAESVREDGALAPAAVWRLVAELGRALADLSATGIVHRDLKPSNVLLSVRGAHLIDFGISKAVDASAITGTGARVGTPAYMSPEYLRTGECDTASDVFSLAGTLAYAATGRAPFGDGTGVDVMHRVAFEEPNAEVMGGVAAADPALAALLTSCLAKEPELRPTPGALIEAAGAHAETSEWPEPLAGRVLARQRAYEVLHRLPVDRLAHLRTDGARPAAPSPPGGEPAPRPASEAPAEPSPEAPREGRSRPAGVLARARRKPALAVAAGITVCAAAAGVFVVTRQDAPATAATPEVSATTELGTVSEGGSGVPLPGRSGDASRPKTSGDGGNVVGGDGGSSPVRSSAPSFADGTSPAAETPRTGTTAGSDPTPSASSTPSEPTTPAWITDCHHYNGNGRTSRGDEGERVLQVQCILTKRGYGVGGGGVDGVFGAATESAVRSFQSDKGLTADGVVGRGTWVALRGTT
jgi:hypothetical protein